MHGLSYSPSQFGDVEIIRDENSAFVGLATPDGVEACTLDRPIVAGKKVLSRYNDACAHIRRILTAKLKLELPRGYSLTLAPEDLAVFFSQECGMSAMRGYIDAKRGQVAAETALWMRERMWDTNPMTAPEALSYNFVFDAETGAIATDGCFNPATRVELPSSIDGVRVRGIKEYALVSYTYLETLIMPDSVTYLEPYAFYDKVHLRNANLSKNLTVIPEGAFSRCRALNCIVIPEGVTRIEAEAFYQCANLFSVYIPDSVVSVGRCAFLNVPHIYYRGSARGFPWGAAAGN